ncbi:MAG: FecR domain-containing protein [Opitutus sp.]
MKESSSDSGITTDESIRETATRWVVRIDRQLSDAESIELRRWLAADPRHLEAFNRSGGAWRKFRDLGAAVRRAPVPVAERPRWHGQALVGLAAAAALALALIYLSPVGDRSAPVSDPVATAPRAASSRQLADGSVARLKEGAEIAEAFTPTERRIRLIRGEAYFTVTKDPSRPFLVQIGNVTVRAVGTAFSIRYDVRDVDVWVTEGTVQVTPPAVSGGAGQTHPDTRESAFVSAGHRAVVACVPVSAVPPIVITTVSPAEIARTLAWNDPMLELSGSPLSELVSAFSERAGRRIEISDPSLASVRIGGRFPTEDLDGFLRALEEIYDVKSDTRPDGTISLSRAAK